MLDSIPEIELQISEMDLELRDGIFGYVPHAKQRAAFDGVYGYRRGVVFQGGNRSGKSNWLIHQVASLLLGIEPWSGRKMPFEVPVRGRLFGEDWTHHVGQVLMPIIREAFPSEEVKKTKRNNQGIQYLWEFKNGSTLEIMTYEQSTDMVEGWSGHFVAMDEPPPRDKYIACRRGLVDYDGIFLMSLTPLKEPWIYDEIVQNVDDDILSIHVDIRDNEHLPADAIDKFEKSLSDDEKEARLHGKWLHLQGLVYKDFDRSVHVIDPFELTHNMTYYAAVDFHPRTEHAVVFVAVDKRGIMYVVDEIFAHGTAEDIASWIIGFHRKNAIDTCLIDALSKGDPHRGQTTYEIIDGLLHGAGIPLETGSKDLDSGVRVVQEALLGQNKMPSLFVFPHCQRTIFEFGHYIWDDWRRGAAQERTVKQKPRSKDDHMLENIRRLLLLPAEYRNAAQYRMMLEQVNRGFKPMDAIAGY